MKQLSMSVSHGFTNNDRHNAEIEYRNGLAHVDPQRVNLNEILVDRDLDEVYEELFGEALEIYNASQTRSDRRIENYRAKIAGSKQEHESYEMIVQVGNKDTNAATDEANRLGSSMIYREFLEKFEKDYPNFRVAQAAIHMDESTPHMHVVYVPVSTGNKRGLETKNSLSGAMRAMGYEDIRSVNSALHEKLSEVAARHGIERLDVGCHRAHLSVRDFKAMVGEIEKDEAYPYRNDPRLMQLVMDQQQTISEAFEVIEEQRITVDSLVREQPSIMSIGRLKEAVADARAASEALQPRIEALQGSVSRFKALSHEIPQWWRNNIVNPVTEALRSAREAIASMSSSTQTKRSGLREAGAAAKAASEALQQNSGEQVRMAGKER